MESQGSSDNIGTFKLYIPVFIIQIIDCIPYIFHRMQERLKEVRAIVWEVYIIRRIHFLGTLSTLNWRRGCISSIVEFFLALKLLLRLLLKFLSRNFFRGDIWFSCRIPSGSFASRILWWQEIATAAIVGGNGFVWIYLWLIKILSCRAFFWAWWHPLLQVRQWLLLSQFSL